MNFAMLLLHSTPDTILSTMLSVVLAFGSGLLIGRFLKSPSVER